MDFTEILFLIGIVAILAFAATFGCAFCSGRDFLKDAMKNNDSQK